MDLSEQFVSNIQAVYKEAGFNWLNGLERQLSQICEKNGLRFIQALPDLTYHFVAIVEMIDLRTSAIIKMAPNNDNIQREASWLQCFTQGVPRVYWFDDLNHAYLMEHLQPGRSLKSMVQTNDDKATRILCETIRAIQSHQHQQKAFRHLSEHIPALDCLDRHIDQGLLSKAKSLFHDLCCDRKYDVLLHGDLHHDNILSCGDTWKVIDPHGYIGDPAFEAGPMIYNPSDCFPEQPIKKCIERRLKILIDELPFDKQRIHAWTFCMTILSIAWTFEEQQQIPKHVFEVACLLDKTRI